MEWKLSRNGNKWARNGTHLITIRRSSIYKNFSLIYQGRAFGPYATEQEAISYAEWVLEKQPTPRETIDMLGKPSWEGPAALPMEAPEVPPEVIHASWRRPKAKSMFAAKHSDSE